MMNNVHKTGVCPVCHRVLRDPKSILAGIGPVCAKKQKAKDQMEMEEKDNYLQVAENDIK